MKSQYVSDYQHINIGERFWVTGFELSKHQTRILRNMPPTHVTMVTNTLPRVCPIGPDGETGLAHPVHLCGLHVVQTEAEAAGIYKDEVDAARKQIADRQKKLAAMANKVDKIIEKLT